MNTVTALVDRYIDMWNETDPARRREIIAHTWTEGGAYVDPLMQASGREAIDAMVGGVQTRFPGVRFTRTSDVDAHNDRCRFSWSLGAGEGPPIAAGLDVAVIAAERLETITGFLDAPAAG